MRLESVCKPILNCAPVYVFITAFSPEPPPRKSMTKSTLKDIRLVLDFPLRGDEPQRLCFKRPLEIIEALTLEGVRPALRAVERATARGFYAAGFVCYEAAPAFDRALVVRESSNGSNVPLLWFGVFSAPEPEDSIEACGEFSVKNWTPSTTRGEYERALTVAREAIARGDTYQINYTFRMRALFNGDAYAFYKHLASRADAGYCAFIDAGRFKILSISPELFFRQRGREIVTRPMKGTVRRGLWLEEDEELAAWLARSEKNRAENIMIVDLLRNDLGRVAETGSVHVRKLCAVERYPTVFQMTSTIAARLRADATLEDTFAALFPCGSVTGAPKISTTRIIASLEDTPRNVYCGSVGLVTPYNEAIFNVAIRTVLIDGETGEAVYGTGGGITWDSTASDEYDEALTKAALLRTETSEFEMLETLRLERGEYLLLERHIRRLQDSARRLDFKVSIDEVRRSLEKHAREFPEGVRRVRLLVSKDGAARVESFALEDTSLVLAPEDEPPSHAREVQPSSFSSAAATKLEPLPVALAVAPVSRSELFLYHKTTRREVYESRRATAPEAFDVLLWNEDEELTEFTNGNLVVELDGQLFTPPRACGLLDGTLRAELLGGGVISERIITRAEIGRSTRLWLINSVRGWVPVFLHEIERGREKFETVAEVS
jgi:para-aminobenzoate synthetase / 4-amino-4-deoxychorismate lyase